MKPTISTSPRLVVLNHRGNEPIEFREVHRRSAFIQVPVQRLSYKTKAPPCSGGAAGSELGWCMPASSVSRAVRPAGHGGRGGDMRVMADSDHWDPLMLARHRKATMARSWPATESKDSGHKEHKENDPLWPISSVFSVASDVSVSFDLDQHVRRSASPPAPSMWPAGSSRRTLRAPVPSFPLEMSVTYMRVRTTC